MTPFPHLMKASQEAGENWGVRKFQRKLQMNFKGDFFLGHSVFILPFSAYCPAGAVALLPENEVKICSPPKINFLHFTRRTPTNVFPHNNNQPGNCLFFCHKLFNRYLSDLFVMNHLKNNCFKCLFQCLMKSSWIRIVLQMASRPYLSDVMNHVRKT